MKIGELSVFFPAYNEAENIESVVKKAVVVLKRLAKKWEVIVVNDGSTDKTSAIVKKLAGKEKRVKMITHQPNRGYGEALKSGLYKAKYQWVAYTDADGQFDFKEIEKFFAKQKQTQADFISGYRVERQDSLLRRFFGLGWTFLVNLFLGIKIKDVDCGFKLVKKEIIDQIPRLQSTRGGMVEPELLAKAKKAGFRIAQVPVTHFPRGGGVQTGANVKVIINSFFDLGRLWWRLR